MEKKITVLVATHKKYNMPTDKMYLPIHVGASGKEKIGYITDETGDNISLKNPYFCELTGMYWAWKNIDSDYIGLAHYRRHFASNKVDKKDLFNSVLSFNEANKLLNSTDIVVPKLRKYYIENLYSHYANTLYIEPLDITGKIIEEKYPKYKKEFDELHKRTSAHMFNMFIMKKEKFDEYCNWLFDILFELEKRVDNSKYNTFHARFYGRVSELLLDVWLNASCSINRIELENKGDQLLVAFTDNAKEGKKAGFAVFSIGTDGGINMSLVAKQEGVADRIVDFEQKY